MKIYAADVTYKTKSKATGVTWEETVHIVKRKDQGIKGFKKEIERFAKANTFKTGIKDGNIPWQTNAKVRWYLC